MRHVPQYNTIYVGAFLPDMLVIVTPTYIFNVVSSTWMVRVFNSLVITSQQWNKVSVFPFSYPILCVMHIMVFMTSD